MCACASSPLRRASFGSKWQSLQIRCRCRRWGAADVKRLATGAAGSEFAGLAGVPKRRMRGSASTIKTICRREQQGGCCLRVRARIAVDAEKLDRMHVSAARIAEAFHARDGDRPRPDLCNALGYPFGQAHAEPCESASDVATTLLRTSPMTPAQPEPSRNI
jgi:hypothetical protein